MTATPDLKLNSKREPFFNLTDWISFWTATLASFVVYFITLAPSVTLEDSGELAVAGDFLGVPHPPGYPIWTIISWGLARIFSFVTFRGQPTPAWSIALGSAIFGALAAGCTAMLISRSGADMLRDARSSFYRTGAKLEKVLCWAGGVGGSLAFAFSPVMWSQSTIVEVYALGAFFMMLIMLLSYRWMRRPSDKLLWITAFVFGLGLTNYQVLLLAALPLVAIIFLRNISLFRDFLLVAIPFGLSALALNLGSLSPRPGLPRHTALTGTIALPNNALIVIGVCVAALSLLLAALWPRFEALFGDGKQHRHAGILTVAGGFGIAVLLLIFAVLLSGQGTVEGVSAPIAKPSVYVTMAILIIISTAAAVVGARFSGSGWNDPLRWGSLLLIGLTVLVMLGVSASVGTPPPLQLQPGQEAFSWTPYLGLLLAGLALLLGLSLTTPNGVFLAAVAIAVEVATYSLLKQGALLGLTHPSTWWFWTPVVFNFVFLLLAWICLPHGANVAMTILGAQLGVSFYIYMPIVSDLRNPPMNWGYARTWEGFKHAITRGQYEKITPTDLFAPRFLQQLGGYFTDLRTQFTLLLAPLGFIPFSIWQRLRPKDRKPTPLNGRLALTAGVMLLVACILWSYSDWDAAHTLADDLSYLAKTAAVLLLLSSLATAFLAGIRPLYITISLFISAVFFVIMGNIPDIERIFDASRMDKLLLGGILVSSAAGGLLLLINQLEDVFKKVMSTTNRSESWTSGLTLAGIAALSLGFLFKLTQAVFTYIYASRSLKLTAAQIVANWSSITMSNRGGLGLSLLSLIIAIAIVAGLVYAFHFLRERDIEYALDDVSQQWLIGTVAAFLVMSVLLIVLANPKGDLQDTFIQKVKFISSHGLYAVWIGYGLIFMLVAGRRVLEIILKDIGAAQPVAISDRTVTMAAIVLGIGAALIPIEQNYRNKQLVFELGGAEQNGHDYGWQFGNYQLRGAAAINEELEADEEPLPNPLYPPEMGRNAIFFGGTDPGRFVPTYMIYSARVREDVFLITQNALADNTYMSTIRDLYGNQIWIPTPEESASAFQIYVEEVQSGKRPKNADLVVENGRVQVSGALGVMEINGILCDMIFKYNKALHPFYIEESYVIPWMYPYLSPHGLIMKINNEHTRLTRSMVNNDQDFWDWYVRRLTHRKSYHRDVVARKSFSKLRSALAGLYNSRGMLREAEQAYQEARMLYFVSPEANFRMIQDVLLRQNRFDEALDLIDLFNKFDPNNERGPGFKDFILDIKNKQDRIAELTAKLQTNPPDTIALAIELAGLYGDIGNPGAADQILTPYLDHPRLTIRQAHEIGLRLDKMNLHAGAVKAMDIVMKRIPMEAPAEFYLSIARTYANANDPHKMIEPLKRYLSKRPNDWQAWADLATVSLVTQDHEQAQNALRKAIDIGKEQALHIIETNPQLRELAITMLNKGLLPNLRPAGGVNLPPLK